MAGTDAVLLVCHICDKAPTSPVATTCGHLFCWPCLCRSAQACPMCGTALREGINIIPVYGSERGSSSGCSGDATIPPRPTLPPRTTRPPAAQPSPLIPVTDLPARFVIRRMIASEERLRDRLMIIMGLNSEPSVSRDRSSPPDSAAPTVDWNASNIPEGLRPQSSSSFTAILRELHRREEEEDMLQPSLDGDHHLHELDFESDT